jgi:hypothetical protein
MQRTHLIRLAVTLTGAAVFAQGALASHEPKNEVPVTRLVSVSRTDAAAARAAFTDVRGEPKNELPFTRPVTP